MLTISIFWPLCTLYICAVFDAYHLWYGCVVR